MQTMFISSWEWFIFLSKASNCYILYKTLEILNCVSLKNTWQLLYIQTLQNIITPTFLCCLLLDRLSLLYFYRLYSSGVAFTNILKESHYLLQNLWISLILIWIPPLSLQNKVVLCTSTPLVECNPIEMVV